MTEKYQDKPFRAPISDHPQDFRLAMERLNRRLDAMAAKLDHLESLLRSANLWTDPS